MSESISSLIDAVRGGDLERVHALLGAQPELVNREEPGSHGLMPLHYAIMSRMPDLVQVLMRAGADPHTTTAGIYALREAASPVVMAIERGYDEIVAIIREKQHRPALDEAAELRRAVESGDEEGAVELLQKRPDLMGLHLPGGLTLLHVVSARLLPRAAAWLLDHGADVNAVAKDGSMPMDVAGLRRGRSVEAVAPMVQMLRARGAAMTVRSAVMLGDVEFLRRKAAEEDLITPRDDRGWLLEMAAAFDRPQILKVLLDAGLDPDARVPVGGEDGFTWGMPLYHCARNGKHAMAEMLLERGADPNGQVYASGTPLSEAFGQRDEAMIALLERYGGKANASMAGLYRRADLARRLLEEHGDASLPHDGFSKGPVAEQLLSAAARGGDPEILAMALERVHTPDGDPRWNGLLQGPLGFWNHWIGPWCHPEWDRATYLTCFKMLLQHSGPPTAPFNGGATILHMIVVMGDHVKMEERLAFAVAALDAGARMDVRDDLLRSTPLGWACRWGREEFVRLFADHGADPIEADAEPWATPLAWAEKKGYAAIAAMLREVRDKA